MHLPSAGRLFIAVVIVGGVVFSLAFFRGRPGDAGLMDGGLTAEDAVATGADAPDAAVPAGSPGLAGDNVPPTDALAAPPPAPDGAAPDTSAPDTPVTASSTAQAGTGTRRYRAGEDPDFAAAMGWPVEGPAPRAGAILPARRIVAYYGNPLSRRMGVLGEYDPEEMLQRLDRQVADWNRSDPGTPAVPALHLVAVVAQAEPGPSGRYRTRMRDALVEQVAEWAATRDALVFLDVQVGTGTVQEELPRLMEFMARPNFHLGIDPEFSMKDGSVPGRKIGTLDAADINYAIELLAQVVEEHDLPPKVLVIHRFTRRMVTNADRIRLDPRVQVVMHMDGWGAPWLKRDTYRDYIVREPVQFTGFKIFYHNDTKKGDPLMLPEDMLKLRPTPVYIQYQ
jgi:hypothetical protein